MSKLNRKYKPSIDTKQSKIFYTDNLRLAQIHWKVYFSISNLYQNFLWNIPSFNYISRYIMPCIYLRRMYMTLHNLKIINMSYVLTKYYLGQRHTHKYRCIYNFTVQTLNEGEERGRMHDVWSDRLRLVMPVLCSRLWMVLHSLYYSIYAYAFKICLSEFKNIMN